MQLLYLLLKDSRKPLPPNALGSSFIERLPFILSPQQWRYRIAPLGLSAAVSRQDPIDDMRATS